MKLKAILIIIVILLTGSGLAYYRALSQDRQDTIPAELMGSIWPDPQPLPGFELTDHLGNSFGPEQFRGHWTLVFFGYTSCPDICPTTMIPLAGMVAEIEKTGAVAPQVVMVSVDPQRDDTDSLAKYVQSFNDDFIGANGDEAQLYAFALNMGAMYSKEEANLEGGYDVAHSASVFLVDPQVRKYGLFSPPLIPAFMAENLEQIQAYYTVNNAE